MPRRISRRTFLRNLGVGAGAAAFAASGLNNKALAHFAPGASLAAMRQASQTFTYWTVLSQNVAATLQSYNDMACYQELEKRTGVHIDFQHVSDMGAQTEEQFNLFIASGQYTDIIERNWLNVTGGPGKYLNDGVIIPLNELVDQHAPNLKKVLDDHPAWRKEVVTDDGTLYSFPFIRGDVGLQVFQGPIVRKDWLDKLGIEMPTTLDEWHEMLVAFKTKDPNGNGQADEVPFTSSLYSQPLNSFLLAHAFIGAWGIAMEWYQEAGKVMFGMLQPEFKEFLTVMAQWYKEGLYDVDFPTMDTKLQDAKVTGNQLGSFVQNTGGGIGKYLGLMKADPNFKVVAAPYPTLKKGDVPILGQRDRTFPGEGLAITTACKDPVAVVKWADYAYGEEGHILFNFGVEGLSFNWVDGYPKYTDTVTKDPKLALQQSMARFFRSNFNGPFVQDIRYFEQYAALPEQQESVKLWSVPSNEKQLPPVTQTQDESQRFASIMNDINTLRNEAVIKIIVGQMPVSDWDGVVSQMKQIGIEEAIALRQAALDRFNAR